MLRAIIQFKAKELFLCLFSALLLILSFSSSNVWVCAWFGFVPFFFALRDTSKGKAFLLSYCTGLVFWAGTIYWLIHVTLLGQILLIGYLALYFGIFGMIVAAIDRRPSLIGALVIPAAWVLFEYVRTFLFTGFPWALLGYSQYKILPVIQIADIIGAWGVSFLVMLVNVGLYWAWRSRSAKTILGKKIVIVVAGALAMTLAYGVVKLAPTLSAGKFTTLKVSVIQANIPQELKWEPAAKSFIVGRYTALSKEAANDAPDLIVWPEASNPDIIGEEDFVVRDIFSLVRTVKIPFLIGSVVKDGNDYYNSALLIGGTGTILQRYDKLHLVPFGEYIPLKNILPFLQTVVPIGDIVRGTHRTIFHIPVPGSAVSGNFAVLICFEDLFPALSRDFLKSGAHFLVNITNDAWYKKTSAATQHFQASVFRAVENRVSVVRAANTGISGFIAPDGRITTMVKNKNGENIFVRGYATQAVTVPRQSGFTLYTRFGDVFIFVLLIFLMYSIVHTKT